jgi:hypothetical protein
MALLQPAPAGSLQSVGESLAVYDNIYQRKEDEKNWQYKESSSPRQGM